jgi:hypothetical protein
MDSFPQDEELRAAELLQSESRRCNSLEEQPQRRTSFGRYLNSVSRPGKEVGGRKGTKTPCGQQVGFNAKQDL